MMGVIAKFKVQPDKVEEFEQIFRETVGMVRANEPGSVLYQLTRSRTEPNSYKLIEIYNEQAAFDHHVSTDHFKATMGRLMPLLAGTPEPDYFDAVS